MKLWNKIKWQAAKTGCTLIEDDFWRWWQEQDALKAKGAAEPLTQAGYDTRRALMVWSDDGGRTA